LAKSGFDADGATTSVTRAVLSAIVEERRVRSKCFSWFLRGRSQLPLLSLKQAAEKPGSYQGIPSGMPYVLRWESAFRR
jgi:hypothetical protein